jgi:hypothetical protein
VAYFKTLFQHLLGGVEENHEKLRLAWLWTEMKILKSISRFWYTIEKVNDI